MREWTNRTAQALYFSQGWRDGALSGGCFPVYTESGFWSDDLYPGWFIEKKWGGAPPPKTGHQSHSIASPLLRVDLDIPARYRVLCLVVRISLCIGAVPDLDIEVIDIHTRLAVVLCLHPEGVQALAIDGSYTLELGAYTADCQPADVGMGALQTSLTVTSTRQLLELMLGTLQEYLPSSGSFEAMGFHVVPESFE